MNGKILNYYAGGNTARGFYSLYESNLAGMDRLFILKGGPGTGKSSLMKHIGAEWNRKGYDVQYLHCSSDNNSIDGVIIEQLKVAIVDGTAPHVIEPKCPGAVEDYVNLGTAWDSAQLAAQKDTIMQYTERISAAFQKAYDCFAQALHIHDDWEKIYIKNMDFSKANALTEQLLHQLFQGQTLDKKADVRHRFLGAATPKGAVDFVPNLTEDVTKRYFIKGRPGSGKSTMLKKIAARAEQNGFDVEIYHCGFDPNSLDMVIVRELGFAIFDSTAPHEYFPERESDEIIDMYEAIVTPGTDEKYAEQLADVSGKYSSKMKEAISYLAGVKSLRDELEAIYIEAMNFEMVNKIREDIQHQIEQIAEGQK
ncbi:PRK06851 family protein [Priestia abyssalis]|uniref:PRK06851 family protein n=1 Tax=Priestia abyssalis TaxID=1221450 RepID=UPI000994DF4E|nr:PRK06851 family protein [Priestia abyssalis]